MSNEMHGGQGTKQSGYVTEEINPLPRKCEACIFYSDDLCGNEVVMTDPELVQLKAEDGRIHVEDESCCNLYMSQKSALIYVLRHGETGANKDNRFRGWIEVPLNKEGIEAGKKARKYLAGKGIKEVFCSDLGRAVHTAKLAMPGKNAEHDKLLRPWDVGMFSGKDRDTNQGALNHYIDNPETAIPEGESLKEFAGRQKKAFDKYLKIARQDGPILLVCHASNIIQWEKITENKNELGRPEDVDRVVPGGVMVILDRGEEGLKAEITFGVTEEKSANYAS